MEKLADQCTWPQWTKDNGEFIPHPSTWLNGKRWQDEPASKAGPSPVPDADATRRMPYADLQFGRRS